MTRGRKKDMTMPPSRSLAQQRAYRDRRAKYVADLEERCRVAEAENTRLRQELAIAKAGSSGGFDEDMVTFKDLHARLAELTMNRSMRA